MVSLPPTELTLTIRPGGWVWGVHHETSTGVLNDLSGLTKLAKKRGTRVCADCVSSIGTVDVDLSGVFGSDAGSIYVDPIHTNERGAHLVAEGLWPSIQAALR